MGKYSIDPKMINCVLVPRFESCLQIKLAYYSTFIQQRPQLSNISLCRPQSGLFPSADPCSRIPSQHHVQHDSHPTHPSPSHAIPAILSWLDHCIKDVSLTSCILAPPGLIESHSTPPSPVDRAPNEWRIPASSVKSIAINN